MRSVKYEEVGKEGRVGRRRGVSMEGGRGSEEGEVGKVENVGMEREEGIGLESRVGRGI